VVVWASMMHDGGHRAQGRGLDWRTRHAAQLDCTTDTAHGCLTLTTAWATVRRRNVRTYKLTASRTGRPGSVRQVPGWCLRRDRVDARSMRPEKPSFVQWCGNTQGLASAQ